MLGFIYRYNKFKEQLFLKIWQLKPLYVSKHTNHKDLNKGHDPNFHFQKIPYFN